MNIKTLFLQLGKYGLFGVAATLIHLLSAWAIMYSFATSVFVSNAGAFFIAFAFSYVFQTLYVFASSFLVERFAKFFVVQFGTFLLSYLLSVFASLQNGYLHTLLIVAIMPLISFAIHKFWTFKEI